MNTTELTKLTARLLFAPILVIAVAVLVKGYESVGDGFSAGVIAALALLLQYLALGREETERRLPMRLVPALAFIGLLAALAVAAIPLLRGDPLLTHVPAPGADVTVLGTLEVITAVAFDAAIFLLVLGAAVGIIHTIARAANEEAS
ncbi:MAG: MnhB domain-containing protein [Solirubrobacterales bacterium]